MKKWLIGLVSLTLILSAAGVCAESGEPVLETMAGLEWSFSSGVGAWSSELRIQPDGSFAGEYHDSEMGECADEYPDGTVYFCAFSGRVRMAGRVDDNTWKVRVEKLEKEQGTESIDDGIRFVPADVYGISEGDEMLLYRPGTPVDILSEEMQFWAHVIDQETPPTELEDWFLSSEKNDSGFVGFAAVSMANPWEDMTAEQLRAASGLSFGVPEGAEPVCIGGSTAGELERLTGLRGTIADECTVQGILHAIVTHHGSRK